MRMLAICLLLTGCAHWPLAINIGCHVTDGIQTHNALSRGAIEHNPLIGDSNARLVAVKGIAAGVSWAVYEGVDDDQRIPAMLAMTVPCAAAVYRNYREDRK